MLKIEFIKICANFIHNNKVLIVIVILIILVILISLINSKIFKISNNKIVMGNLFLIILKQLIIYK